MARCGQLDLLVYRLMTFHLGKGITMKRASSGTGALDGAKLWRPGYYTDGPEYEAALSVACSAFRTTFVRGDGQWQQVYGCYRLTFWR